MSASHRLASWFLVVGLAVLGGCGGDSEPPAAAPAAKPPAAEKAPAQAAPAKPAAPAARPSGAAVNLPPDVPQYPGAEVTRANPSVDQGFSVSMLTGDDLEKVAGFYEDQFAAQGWTTNVRPAPGGKAIFADKGGRTAAATMRTSPDGTLIDLIIVQRN